MKEIIGITSLFLGLFLGSVQVVEAGQSRFTFGFNFGIGTSFSYGYAGFCAGHRTFYLPHYYSYPYVNRPYVRSFIPVPKKYAHTYRTHTPRYRHEERTYMNYKPRPYRRR
jgi:hypothetical protein